MSDSPFHDGELYFQRLVGEAQAAERNGVMIKPEILSGAMSFIAHQPMIITATQDRNGHMRAQIIAGSIGFMQVPDNQHLLLDLAECQNDVANQLFENLQSCPYIGCLIIELETRRRLKVNGHARILGHVAEISVVESYPLCPKYIQRRKVSYYRSFSVSEPPILDRQHGGPRIGHDERALISSADTFFVASAYPPEKVDVSHRGGSPGFVQIVAENVLRIPDYAGNSMFNTFGNLIKNSNAGLVFPDFKNASSLQLAGTARILIDQDYKIGKDGETDRFWEFEINEWRWQSLWLLEDEFLDYSRFNP